MTAHSIASINRIAPGRTFSASVRPYHDARHDGSYGPEFREYLRVVRAALRWQVDYTQDGVTRTIQFLHQDLGFIDVSIPSRSARPTDRWQCALSASSVTA